MWYDEKLTSQGNLLRDKKDIQSELDRPMREGTIFSMHGKKWVVIDLMSFSNSGMCKIAYA